LISADETFSAEIAALLPPSVTLTRHAGLAAWRRAGGRGQVLLLDEAHEEATPAAIDALGPPHPPLVLLSRAPESALPAAPWRCRALSRSGKAAGELARALALAAEAGGTAALPRPAGRRLSILVAEDNRTNQRVLAKLLERAGHAVTLAQNGEEALDLMMAERFDVVFMDLNMPVMNGIDAAKLYRFMAAGQPHLPIFALTADATEEAQRLCAEAGMDGVFTKPFEPARLFDLLDRIAGEGSAPEPPPAAGEEGAVAELALHPRFRPAVSGVDTAVLEDLLKLGGPDFVRELIDAFLADSAELVAAIVEAAEAGDSAGVRNHAHALRSASANIGARGLFELCLSWRLIQAQELGGERSAQLIQRLESERDRVRTALLAYRAGLARRAQET
jgi:two-component system sensor histidine kinase RpfC